MSFARELVTTKNEIVLSCEFCKATLITHVPSHYIHDMLFDMETGMVAQFEVVLIWFGVISCNVVVKCFIFVFGSSTFA